MTKTKERKGTIIGGLRSKDPKRIKWILGELEKIWAKSPGMRFGQLLINLQIAPNDPNLYNTEDGETEKKLREFCGWDNVGKSKIHELKEMRERYEEALSFIRQQREEVQEKICEIDTQIKIMEDGT